MFLYTDLLGLNHYEKDFMPQGYRKLTADLLQRKTETDPKLVPDPKLFPLLAFEYRSTYLLRSATSSYPSCINIFGEGGGIRNSNICKKVHFTLQMSINAFKTFLSPLVTYFRFLSPFPGSSR